MFVAEQSISLQAPAKVNLFLEVVGRRPDGYHDLRSLVVPVDICDQIELIRADTIETEQVFAPGFPDDANCLPAGGLRSEQNLATRAACLLRDHTGIKAGVHIRLTKAIPIGGGMGGGSADAAAVLRGLIDLWGLDLSEATLCGIGAQLGSDIPALVMNRAVLMEGRGERVTPLPPPPNGRPDWWVVVVNPLLAVSTGDIYARLRLSLTPGGADIKSMVCAWTSGDLERAVACLRNDLQATVLDKYPVIGLLVGWLQAAGAPGVLVSGSGASVFGLAPSREAAERVRAGFAALAEMPTWSRIARLLPDGVMAAHGPLEA